MEKLLEHIGIRAVSVRQLPSERDQNFLLTDDSGQQFVLKVANTAESRAFLEAQNAALDYLSQRVSFCPRVIGEIVEFEGHLVRLVTYLPGWPLAETRPHTHGLLSDLGKKIGQLSRALADFDHPAVHRDFYWDLANGNRILIEYAPLIKDAYLRGLILKYGRFEPKTELRRSVIHGDLNDYNVLVDPGSMTVSGLIDFGDMVYSYTVGELAIALAYVVLCGGDTGDARDVIDAYRSEFGLLEEEREALWPLVKLRLAMSACIAAYQQQQQPENEYLGISQRAIREFFARISYR